MTIVYDIEKAGIHSYRYRTKKAGHLLEKIIRKKSEQPDQYKYINRKNYYKYMTDLIGIGCFSFTVRIGSIFTITLRLCLKMIRQTISKTVSWILMMIRSTITLRSGQRCTVVPVIPVSTIKNSSTSNRMVFTDLFTISSNIRAIT